MMPGVRPSLWRPSAFAATWQLTTWVGLSVCLASVTMQGTEELRAMGAPFAMVVAVIILSELRPVVMTRLDGNPVSISLAFIFAALYVWGLAPAVVLMAGSVIISEVLQRKPLWKLLFNVGQYTICLTAAWLVLRVAGVATNRLTVVGLIVVVVSWAVFHLVNLALVAGMARSAGQTWWSSFSDEFWFYTVSVLAVLALSPIIAAVLLSDSNAWLLLPLLLVPLLAVQRAAEMSRENEHQALHDPLTGLPNRALLADRIDQALARGLRTDGAVAVLFLDVDLFKVVNDSLGHAAGDRLLREIGARLGRLLRAGDTLARFGGDEFVIVCEDQTIDEVPALAERVSEALADPFEFEGRTVTVTASVGIALAHGTTDAGTMLRDADAAMYRAKAAGRDRAVVFDEGMHEDAAQRLEAEFGLRRALDNGELQVHYQPVVDARSGLTVGFEALVRWNHPEFGLLPPDRFIPVAEETGLIVALGEWVLREAVRQVAAWRSAAVAHTDVWVAVNLSARQLRAPHLVTTLADCLSEVGVPASVLHLEITESVIMDDLPRTKETLEAIRDLGVLMAIDDFGTGYSSLSYLRRLPVSTIKIDRSFVDALDGPDASATTLVDAIVSMAHALGMEAIAEGVETPDQLRTLRELGVHLSQGYLWSRPLPSGQATDWLRHDNALPELDSTPT